MWAVTRQMNLSARAYNSILKLARTIADLAGSKNIQFRISGRGFAKQAKVVKLLLKTRSFMKSIPSILSPLVTWTAMVIF